MDFDVVVIKVADGVLYFGNHNLDLGFGTVISFEYTIVVLCYPRTMFTK